ncbi:hypothetical protein Bbelb_268860 [Branchiostoma belcheri]|nr:hypothetical protein Bbelb_268860 [Branchiostoma belcheri]
MVRDCLVQVIDQVGLESPKDIQDISKAIMEDLVIELEYPHFSSRGNACIQRPINTTAARSLTIRHQGNPLGSAGSGAPPRASWERLTGEGCCQATEAVAGLEKLGWSVSRRILRSVVCPVQTHRIELAGGVVSRTADCCPPLGPGQGNRQQNNLNQDKRQHDREGMDDDEVVTTPGDDDWRDEPHSISPRSTRMAATAGYASLNPGHDETYSTTKQSGHAGSSIKLGGEKSSVPHAVIHAGIP